MENEKLKSLFNELLMLDKEISVIENKKKNIFFDNIETNDKEGEISVPLVTGIIIGDYEKLKQEKKHIRLQIKQLEVINKYMKKYGYVPEEYHLSKFNIDCTENLESEINERIDILEQKLKLIDEDPKVYLRYKEYEHHDYSSISNIDAINELKSMDNEERIKQQNRKEILFKIKLISNNVNAKESNKKSKKLSKRKSLE